MQSYIMGWDIGGAHLKAAIIQPPASIIEIHQRPCPLWKGIGQLQQAAQEILEKVRNSIGLHVLTMTGELVDCFEGRDDGVEHILTTMRQLLPNGEVVVYAGKDGFIELEAVKTGNYPNIASANWLASATWAAQQVGTGLFVDIGSTTTDILLLNNGKVEAQGYSDYERLVSQEMVYTGIVRTAVMSVAQEVQDEGKEVGLMAEYFATMADVYRVTGELNEAHDQYETADGAEKTLASSAKRLARMIGCDYRDGALLRWQQLAKNLRQQQLARIQMACVQQLSRLSSTKDGVFIGAGIGRFLAKEIAPNLGYRYQDFNDLFLQTSTTSSYSAADCAPAAAVACLAAVGANDLS